MPTEYSLASLAQIKSHLSVQAEETKFDEQLTSFGILATQLIEQELDLSFLRADRVEYKDSVRNYSGQIALWNSGSEVPDGLDVRDFRIMLDGYPLADDALVEVRYDDIGQVFGDDTIIPANFTLIEASGGRVILSYPIDTLSKSLKISYTSGYAVDYEDYLSGDPLYDELTQAFDLTTNMTDGGGLAAMFDENNGKPKSASATFMGKSAYVVNIFDTPQIASEVRWQAPSDDTPQSGVNQVTMFLEGNLGVALDGPWVVIASKWFLDVQAGDLLEMKVPTGFATPYKSLRVRIGDENAPGPDVTFYSAQIEFLIKNMERPFLRGAPKRLVMACALAAKYLWTKSRTGAIGLETAPERKSTRFVSEGALPPEVLQMIAFLRRTRMGG